MNKLTEAELYLYFYKDILTAERTKREIDFVKAHCNLLENSYLLDIPCFFGRHTLSLAAEMPLINLVAADITFQYLYLAKQTAAEKNLSNVYFVQTDVRKMCFKNFFNCILCLYTSFGYFTDEENMQILNQYRQCLYRNGVFYLDVINPNKMMEGEIIFANKGNDKILDINKKAKSKGFWNTKRKYIVGGGNYEFDYKIRLYTERELYSMLLQAGFSNIDIYGDFDSSAYTDESNRIIIVARC